MERVHVHAQKYGGIAHYDWETTFVERTGDYVLVQGERKRELVHHTKGKKFIMDNPTIEYFPLNEWFTVSIELIEGREFGYYCNICMPSTLEGSHLTFIDLDLDLIKRPAEDWKVVDEDEFRANAVAYRYPDALIARAIAEKDKLSERIQAGAHPFDGWLENKVRARLMTGGEWHGSFIR